MEVAWPRITAPPMATSPEAVFLRLPYLTISDPPSRREKLPILTLRLAEGFLINPAR